MLLVISVSCKSILCKVFDINSIKLPTCNLLLRAMLVNMLVNVDVLSKKYVSKYVIFKPKGPNCKKKELYMNLNSNNYQKKSIKTLINVPSKSIDWFLYEDNTGI